VLIFTKLINDDLCTAFTSYLNVTMNSTYAMYTTCSFIMSQLYSAFVLILNHIPQIF